LFSYEHKHEKIRKRNKTWKKIADNAELIWGWGTSAGQHGADRRGIFFRV